MTHLDRQDRATLQEWLDDAEKDGNVEFARALRNGLDEKLTPADIEVLQEWLDDANAEGNHEFVRAVLHLTPIRRSLR